MATAVAVALTGCDSGGSSSGGANDINAQAIDGYIVAANVSCDDVAGDPTAAAGRFACPAGTELMTIEGGMDVGDDATATSGGIDFIGVLKAPGTLAFVTPLSSLVVEMSAESGDDFETALEQLKAAFGVSDLELNADPMRAENLAIAKLNAQVHQLVESFAASKDEYRDVVKAFAKTVRAAALSNEVVHPGNAAEKAVANLNSELASSASALARNGDSLAALIALVKSINENIERAKDLTETVDVVRTAPVKNALVQLDREEVEVYFRHGNGQGTYELADFENDTRTDENVFRVNFAADLESIGFDRKGLRILRSANDVTVGLGFEITSLDDGDDRKLSLTTRGAKVSMNQDDAQSIVVSVPDGTVVNVKSRMDGTQTNASWTKSGKSVFRSSDNFIDVDMTTLNNRLLSKGIDGFIDTLGNYEVKLVLDGIKIALTGDGDARLGNYTIESHREAVSGRGFKGYVSYTD